MDSQADLRDRAKRSLKVAEHMLTQTYPIVNDPKLILAISEDIYTALSSSMSAITLSEGDFHQDFADFKQRSSELGFKEDEIDLIERFHSIITEHKESPVEFARKDKFVICDEKYNFDSLSLDDMKSYLFRARLFVEKAEAILDSKENK